MAPVKPINLLVGTWHELCSDMGGLSGPGRRFMRGLKSTRKSESVV